MDGRKAKIVFAVMTILTVPLFFSLRVYAGEGSGDTGNGVPCYKDGRYLGSLCTRYGALWKWYPTSSDSVVIPGKDGSKCNGGVCNYATGTVITGCAKYGGYWRYAMEAYASAKLDNGASYNTGDQVGVVAIGGEYRSVHFGGIMQDRNSASWDKAQAVYLKLQSLYPSEFVKGWDRNSDLAWFCGGEDPSNPGPIGENPPDPTPPPEEPDECGKWTPSSYTNSNATYGETTIDVKIKNMESRFGGTGFGDWNDGTIYAKPTDEVAWNICYYGGTPATANTKVSSASGNDWRGYDDLNTDDCGNPNTARGHTTENNNRGGLDYLYKFDTQTVKMLAQPISWENKFDIWGAGQAIRSGYSTEGGSFNDEVKTTAGRKNGYVTQQGEAGQTFTESGRTGSPNYVSVSDRSGGSVDINKSACPPEPVYDDVKVVDGYDWDGSEIYHYESQVVDYLPTKYECYTCTNKYKDRLPQAYIRYQNSNDNASVKVPYNFENIPGVALKSEFVYSGEIIEIDQVWSQTVPRYNSVTLDTYATQVPSAKMRLFAYVTSDPSGGSVANLVTSDGNGCDLVGRGIAKQCLELDHKNNLTLNASGNLSGSFENHNFRENYNALDAAAGDYMCVVSQVFPATSGDEKQMGTRGDGNWRYSAPACVIIAKKPTFQVWGSGLYAADSLNAALGAKRNLYNDYINNMNNFNSTTSRATFFGSWSEQDLILKSGYTNTVSSGAATGYNNIPSGAGSKIQDFCTTRSGVGDRSPLSFSNNCTTGGLLGTAAVGDSGIDSGATNREELLDYWIGESGGSGTVGNVVNLSRPDTIGNVIKTPTDVQVHYAEASGNVNMSGTVPVGETYFIKVNGKVTFTGDVKYASGPYGALNTIPKLVIYAQNFDIQCNVSEVDAILIGSEGSVLDTCSDASDDVNDSKRSSQLKIFGVAMIDAVELKRTYGAATWNQSQYATKSDAEAAEIFDYDSTILMWSEFLGGTAETDVLQTSYQHEIAPRY